MAAFADPAERVLLADLKEAGVLTPAVMDAIHSALGRAERYSLDEFLLAGADAIDERHWLSWLIRHHECYRFGPVRLDEAAAGNWPPPATRDMPLPSNLPYCRIESGMYLIAVLRPDQETHGFRAAATLAELKELRTAWRRRI